MHDALSLIYPHSHSHTDLEKKHTEFRQRVDKHEIIPLVLCYGRISAFYRIGNKSCARKFKPFARLYPFGSVALIHSFIPTLSLCLRPKFECLFCREAHREAIGEGKRECDPFLPAIRHFGRTHSRMSAPFTCPQCCRRRVTNDCVVRLYQSLYTKKISKLVCSRFIVLFAKRIPMP